jgi:alpha-tubulin suppressor-like RCC1 family protein
MRIISVFLIAVALVGATVGYGGRESYTLTIVSTTGGSAITPGEGTFTYYEGTMVDLVAGLEAGYRFVNWTGDVGTIADVNDATTTITINDHCSITANFEKVNFMVVAGYYHTVGLRSDGTVVAVGYSDRYYGQSDVDGWMDITQVTAGYAHTVGLKEDGTMVAVGYTYHGECNVGNWSDIIRVAAGHYQTVGLKSDGTVVAVGDNRKGQCDVGGWTDIVQVAAGYAHTVGLREDGTVVAVGYNDNGQCDVGGWTDIVQVAAGDYHTVGVRSNGTVVAVGWNDFAQCAVGNWDLN